MTTHTISGIERQNQILQRIKTHHRISISDICKNFSVSEATARRDLEMLAVKGKVLRVHGGAITIEKAPPEMPMILRQADQADEKQRIGAAGAKIVKEGDTIFLGSGTTVLEVARYLLPHITLTVITNSLPVINLLSVNQNITIVCLGGILRPSEFSFIGHITEQALSEVRVDKVFLGVRAISLNEGLTNDYLPETLTDRAILKIGQEIIVVADHTKFGRISTAMLVPIEKIQTLITGFEIPIEFINEITQRNIRVITV